MAKNVEMKNAASGINGTEVEAVGTLSGTNPYMVLCVLLAIFLVVVLYEFYKMKKECRKFKTLVNSRVSYVKSISNTSEAFPVEFALNHSDEDAKHLVRYYLQLSGKANVAAKEMQELKDILVRLNVSKAKDAAEMVLMTRHYGAKAIRV